MNKMNIKYTLDEVRKIVGQKGYELISDEYINIDEKLIIKDVSGYYYFNSLYSIMNHKPTIVDKSNPYSIQNIKLWLKHNHKEFELISETYINSKENLKWKCLKPECGEVFEHSWDLIRRGRMCLYCVGHLVSQVNCLATRRPDLAEEWHPTKNGDLTPYDVTCGNDSKKIWWQCRNNSKHIWDAFIYNRTISDCNCPYCSGRYPHEDYNLLICNPILASEWNYEKNNKNPEDFTPNANKYVWWKCKECNHEWYAQINNRNRNGCPKCNKSKGERKIMEYLKGLDIVFEPQKKFEKLLGVGNGLLSYDFYLPKYNLLIEYQGEQHERYIPGFHKSKNDFKKQLEHDKRKREYAITNKYNLLEIWHSDYDNIENIISEKLNIIINDSYITAVF